MAASCSSHQHRQRIDDELEEIWLSKFSLLSDHTMRPSAPTASDQQALISLTLHNLTISSTEGRHYHPKTKVQVKFNLSLLKMLDQAGETLLSQELASKIAFSYINYCSFFPETPQKIAKEIASELRGYYVHGRLQFICNFVHISDARIVIHAKFWRLAVVDVRPAEMRAPCPPPVTIMPVANITYRIGVEDVLRGEKAENAQQEGRRHDTRMLELIEIEDESPPVPSMIVREIGDRQSVYDALCGYSGPCAGQEEEERSFANCWSSDA